MFKVAIIGPGSIGETYAKALADSEKVRIVAVLGNEQQGTKNFGEKYRVNWYTDPDIMYQTEKPDGVIICTPTFTHYDVAVKAMEYKVHIMCEKPFTLNADTARDLFDKSDIAGVRIMAMQVVRFWPEYVYIKNLIKTGELGSVKNVYAHRLSAHPKWCTWHKDPQKSGGGLYDLHIHDIDYLYHLFGKVKSVYATAVQEVTGCYNNISTILNFECGISAVVEGFMDITGDWQFCTNVRINGSNAAVEFISKQGINNFTFYPEDGKAQQLQAEKYNPYRAETEYFADCVTDGKPTDLVPNNDVVEVLRAIEAIQKSIESKSVIIIE